jgi:hypothetical protein
MSADSVPCEATALEPRMGTLKLSGAGPAAVSRAVAGSGSAVRAR